MRSFLRREYFIAIEAYLEMKDESSNVAPMNVVGWILVVVGAVGLLASIFGIICVLGCQNLPHSLTSANLHLHDSYYVMHYSVWPMILCLVLSVAISIVGYMHTELYLRKMMPMESGPSRWESPPEDVE